MYNTNILRAFETGECHVVKYENPKLEFLLYNDNSMVYFFVYKNVMYRRVSDRLSEGFTWYRDIVVQDHNLICCLEKEFQEELLFELKNQDVLMET